MARRLSLFEAAGLELEYMVVHRQTGAVAPCVDRIMLARTGEPASECRLGRCVASNELAAHVFELKVPRPTPDFDEAERRFTRAVNMANAILETHDCELLPGPMHPTMDPTRESTIWAHEGREIYETYDRIFGCHGHGWFNLQSCHINLPFADDREFGLLHAAIILLLPMLPALAAGSPFCEGRVTGWTDTRLDTYRNNQKRFPLITGEIIPEPVFTEADYRTRIFEPMMAQVRPADPDNILEAGWLNSRGAIARFGRGAIEIRVLDVQECPRADMAIARLIFHTLREMVSRHGSALLEVARRGNLRRRKAQFLECAAHGLDAPFRQEGLRSLLQIPGSVRTAREFWQAVFDQVVDRENFSEQHADALRFILRNGNLADRLLSFHEKNGESSSFPRLLRELADCLAENRMFDPLTPGK